ncbi:MAG TPA: hypothetical protein VD927_06155 [Chryseosolibacter sp.]|nr:hypothetical protein [Chryseosolibacter sp.]
MANRFLTRANALHPDEADSSDEKYLLQGRQDVLYECYMNSFSKSVLLSFLQKASEGDIGKIPDGVDDVIYKRAYVKESEAVINEMGANE